MNLIKKLVLTMAVLMAMASTLSYASDPFPDCYPCESVAGN